MLKARDVMVGPIITVSVEDSLETVAARMLDHRIGCVPVLDAQGCIAGVITPSDFAAKERGIPFSGLRLPQVLGEWVSPGTVERIYEASRQRKAKEVMSRPVVVVSEDDTLHHILTLMLQRDINHVPVVREGQPVGIISRFDLLRLMLEA